jgi:phosphoribosylformimino-5-aminoimidazole carboxamide ribotide isomerase
VELIAAIDLINGRGVRLEQGDYGRLIPGADDPAGLARRWAAAGVRRLHLIDLDGARAGEPRQQARMVEIARAVPQVTIEAGGGLRSEASVEALLEAGIDFVILGTAALERPDFLAGCTARWPGRILVSLDLRDGVPALDGWLRDGHGDALAIAARLLGAGAAGLLITDTRRDGTLAGPNLELLSSFRRAFPDAWLSGAGGVGSLDDLLALRGIGLDGAVVGLALLTGAVALPDALDVLARPPVAG